MPVILAPEHFDQWLDCRPGTSEFVRDLLRPAPDDALAIVEVSARLNNPRNEGPEVQEPVRSTLF